MPTDDGSLRVGMSVEVRLDACLSTKIYERMVIDSQLDDYSTGKLA